MKFKFIVLSLMLTSLKAGHVIASQENIKTSQTETESITPETQEQKTLRYAIGTAQLTGAAASAFGSILCLKKLKKIDEDDNFDHKTLVGIAIFSPYLLYSMYKLTKGGLKSFRVLESTQYKNCKAQICNLLSFYL